MTARYGIASVVRAIEVLGEALLDIRRAPDPRLVLEVTLVRLASNSVANDTSSLLARLERLESAGARPRDVTGPIPRPRLADNAAAPARPPRSSPAAKPVVASGPPAASGAPVDDLVAAWPGIVRTLKATVRALYSAVEVAGLEGDTLVVVAPSEMHKKKCLELADNVRSALASAAGRPITLDVRVHPSRNATSPTERRTPSASQPAPSVPDAAEPFESDDEAPVESVVDRIAKSFPGARIVDSPPG
jgi:DNA polymerase-3 subunit gamma/tau